MSLQEKYKELIDAAHKENVSNLAVSEAEGVLHIEGIAANATSKQQLWDIYEKLDPGFTSGDMVLNINATEGIAEGAKLKVTTNKSNLNIRKAPGIDQAIIGKATHGEIITLVKKESDQWWYIKTDNGQEGFCFTQYLTPLG